LARSVQQRAASEHVHRRAQCTPVNHGSTQPDHDMHEGLLLYHGRVVVPEAGSLREDIIRHFHDSKFGGYSGVLRTWMRIASTFYWPGLRGDVRDYVGRCDECQRTKADVHRPGGLLQPLPVPARIWEDITMDFIEGLPLSNGFNGVMVVVDRLTKYAHFIPLTHPYTAKSIAKLFVEYVMTLHGLPRSIVSDRDRIFMSSFWSEFFKLQGTELSMSSTYHPQTDGQTEVTNRTLEQYLRCYVHQFPKRWEDYLPWAEYWYNTTYHSSIKAMPFELVYGRKPPTIVSYSMGSAVNDEVDRELVEHELMLRELKRTLEGSINMMKAYHDGKRRDVEFEPGDWVYLKLRPFGKGRPRPNSEFDITGLITFWPRLGRFLIDLSCRTIPIFIRSYTSHNSSNGSVRRMWQRIDYPRSRRTDRLWCGRAAQWSIGKSKRLGNISEKCSSNGRIYPVRKQLGRVGRDARD
ncbi:Unknown protein, partial [Striga hermonthica]